MSNQQESFNDDNGAAAEAWRQFKLTVRRFPKASLKKDSPQRIDHIVVDVIKLPTEAVLRKHYTLEQYAAPLRWGSYAAVLVCLASIAWAIFA